MILSETIVFLASDRAVFPHKDLNNIRDYQILQVHFKKNAFASN
jgi:hypothetical protein